MTLTEAIEYCERKQRDHEIDASNATSKSVWDRETEAAEALRLVVDAAKRLLDDAAEAKFYDW